MDEIARITGLRRTTREDDPLPRVGVPLRRVQAEGLREWRAALLAETPYGPPGLAVLAGCGEGKTLLALLLPSVAAGVLGRDLRTLYLVPPAIRAQWRADALAWASRGARVPRDPTIRTHGELSAPSGRDLLDREAPDLLVIDEAHAFGDPDSGRWRRVIAYLRRHPGTRIVLLSGSISSRSVRECRHLLLAALRGWCPLPADGSIDYWSSALDANTDARRDDYRAMAGLVEWAGLGRPDRDTCRAAYRKRVESCPGIVLGSREALDVSLRLDLFRGLEEPPAIAAARGDLSSRWVLPDGSELVSALEYARHAASLPLGHYLRWRPETVDPVWVEARREWQREVRLFVTYQGHRYQTPGQVEQAAKQGTLPIAQLGAYSAWTRALAERRAPETEVVWLEGGRVHLVETIRLYLRDYGPRALIWCRSPAVGEVVASFTGAVWHGEGSSPPDGRADVAVASYLVHGTGWDGASRAGYTRALVLEPPTGGGVWEQLLARLHRPGARADVVYAVHAPSPSVIDRAVADARYIVETTGQPQRLLTADWSGYRPPGRV